jgi:uncharacterized protein
VIAVDSNILVFAHRLDSPWHDAARECVRKLAEGASAWLIPWPCVHEFISAATHPRVFTPPSPIEVAVRQIEFWMESPSLVLGGESTGHWQTLRDLALRAKLAGPVVHDARVAAICLDHAVDALWTADRDFSRFPALRTVNPLLA